MPELELIEVRVDVRQVDADDIYFVLEDEDASALERGDAAILRVEATVVPASPGLTLYEAPPWDDVVRTPITEEDVEFIIEKALMDLAEDRSDAYRLTVTAIDLRAAASVTVHGDLPPPPT